MPDAAAIPTILTELPAVEFDLRRTLECGQVFHAMPLGEGWQILAGRTLLHLEQHDGILRVPPDRHAVAAHYLALDHPLPAIYAAFPRDPFSRAALAACRGLRILRQPLWECLATFITSPMKQVSHIRQMSLALRRKFGAPVNGSMANAFPEPDRLARKSESVLRACGLGFRAPHLLAAARAVASGAFDLSHLAALTTDEARDSLCRLSGVGRKVANCVLLFACERLDAVPVDVWMSRILAGMRGRPANPLELERYSTRRFGAYAGYIQQYLFHHARTSRTLPAA